MIKSKGGWPASGAIQPLPTGLAKVSIHPTETFELVFAKVRKGAIVLKKSGVAGAG
jgi:hypothetical protein